MSTLPTSFDAMFAARNERYAARVRGHLEQALAADLLFIVIAPALQPTEESA